MAETVIRIGMDTTEIDAGLDRTGSKIKKAAKDTSDSLEGILLKISGISPKLLGIAGAIGAVNQVARMANDIAERQSAGNKDAGTRNMAILDAAQRAGIDATVARNFANNTVGSTTPEGKMRILNDLAAENDRRRAMRMPNMPAKTAAESMALYDQLGDVGLGQNANRFQSILQQPGGVYNINAVARQQLGSLVGAPRASLDQIGAINQQRVPDVMQYEVETRRQEGLTADSDQEFYGTEGIKARRGAARRRQMETLNPWMGEILRLPEMIPGAGEMFKRGNNQLFEAQADRLGGPGSGLGTPGTFIELNQKFSQWLDKQIIEFKKPLNMQSRGREDRGGQ